MDAKHQWLQSRGKRLRIRVERENEKNHEELPTRWVELIHRLDEEERRRAKTDRERR